ncbi:MAG: hypothetical protein JSS89_12845 [Bacteroidetes bacterium]|nr:hypothetical protein [Bacteroidota bacterium]
MLGHTAHILIACADVPTSIDAWCSIGFTELAVANGDVPTWARLTDGQVIVMLMNDVGVSPALAYFHADPPVLRQRIHDRGGTVTAVSPTELHVRGPGDIPIYVHAGKQLDAERPSKESNPLLGYHLGICVSVADAASEKSYAERMGFLVAEQAAEPFPRFDMTDGLASLILQQTSMSIRPLVYTMELDNDVVRSMQEAMGDRCTVFSTPDGDVFMVRLDMPEGTTILVNADD